MTVGDKQVFSAEESVKPCNICTLPLEGVMIGDGDGTGQKFAHPICYYKKRMEESHRRISELETQARAGRWLVGEQHRPGCVRPYTCDCFYDSKIADLERQLKEAVDAKHDVAEYWQSKYRNLEQQVRELKHILSVIHEEDLLPMAFALDGGKEIRDVVKEIVKENP